MKPTSTNLTIQQICKKTTEYHAKSFAFAAQKLPNNLENDVYVIYTFCRISDDLVDEQEDKNMEEIKTELNVWKSGLEKFLKETQKKEDSEIWENQKYELNLFEIKKLHKNQEIKTAILKKTAEVIKRRQIDPKTAFDLIYGVSIDLEEGKFKTFLELENYCHFVAGIPGVMMAELFNINDKTALKQADLLGKAMQITNILRDIKEDFQRGRIYIPEEDLEKFGVSLKDLENGEITEEFKNLMKYYIKLSRKWYTEARPGIKALPDEIQVSIRSAARIYEKILDKIEKQNYDIFKNRASTSKFSKIRSFARISIINAIGL